MHRFKRFLRWPTLTIAGLVVWAAAFAATTPFKTYVTGLSAASALGGTELLPCIQGGNDVNCTPNQILTFLNLAAVAISGSAADLTAGTLAAARMPALTGDVTSSAGAVATTIAAGAVTLAKQANLAANSFECNNTGSAATPIACTTAQSKSLLAIASGDVSGLATSATTDTTNASNISSGTLGAARMPLGLTGTPTAGQFPVGNAGGTAYAAQSLSGDATLASTGALTIGAGAVTLAKQANLAANSFECNNTGSAATPIACTTAQSKSLLAIANTDVSGLGTLSTQSGTFSGTSSGTNTGDQTAANPSGTIGLSAVNGSSTSFMRADGAPALGVGIAPTWTGVHTYTPTQASNTSVNSILLSDTTAATAANQQYSPSIILTGQGWKTTATAASQQVDWKVENRPVQGAANPTTLLAIASQVNGGGYTDQLTISSSTVNGANFSTPVISNNYMQATIQSLVQATPYILWNANGQGTNLKDWWAQVSGTTWSLATVLDAQTTPHNAFSCTRGATTTVASCILGNATDATSLTYDGALISGGTTFTTISGCGTAASLTGGVTTGSFTVGTGATPCTFVVTLPTAPHGWYCAASDQTTAIALPQSANSTTSCSIKGNAATSDVIVFSATGY